MPVQEKQMLAQSVVDAHQSEKTIAILDFKRYRWYELVILLPVIIAAIQGGLIGTGLGLVALELALRWLRSDRPLWLAVAGALGISLIFLAVYGLIVYLALDWAQRVLGSLEQS